MRSHDLESPGANRVIDRAVSSTRGAYTHISSRTWFGARNRVNSGLDPTGDSRADGLCAAEYSQVLVSPLTNAALEPATADRTMCISSQRVQTSSRGNISHLGAMSRSDSSTYGHYER